MEQNAANASKILNFRIIGSLKVRIKAQALIRTYKALKFIAYRKLPAALIIYSRLW